MIIFGIDTNPSFSAIAIVEITKNYEEKVRKTLILKDNEYIKFLELLKMYKPELVAIEMFQWYSDRGINRYGINSIVAIGYFKAICEMNDVKMILITKPMINATLSYSKRTKKSQIKKILELRLNMSFKDTEIHCIDAVAVALAGFYNYAQNNYLEIRGKLDE